MGQGDDLSLFFTAMKRESALGSSGKAQNPESEGVVHNSTLHLSTKSCNLSEDPLEH